VAEVHQVAEQAIIERAREGERDALGVIWRIYHPQLLRLLRAQRAPNPDDIASQVWIDVGRALARFEGDGVDFRRWIFTIASRRSTDEVRRIGRRREDFTVDVEGRANATDTVHVDHIDLDSLDDALELVATLAPTMAEAIMLRLIHDMTFDEVAAVMRTSEGNARVLVHRGLTKLRAEIARRSESDTTHRRPVQSGTGSAVRIAAVQFDGEKK
jgi:RNA polymerase sigma-70 factor, ECF subfamily